MELIGPLVGFLFLVGLIVLGIVRMRKAEKGTPEVIHLKKTAGLPAITQEDVISSGLHEVTLKSGPDERNKHIYKGSDPGGFLTGSISVMKRAPQGLFLFMNKGLVFLSKGPTRLTFGKALEITFDKVGGQFGALGGLASGLVTGLAEGKRQRDLANQLTDFLSRPETFIIPYSEIIEARHVKSTFVDRLLNFKRQTANGHVEEYWVRPTEPWYPQFLMTMRLNTERQSIFEQLVAEKADSATLLSQFIADGRQRHPGGAKPEDISALTKAYVDALTARLAANGTSLAALEQEADQRVRAAFANTPLLAEEAH